MSKTPGCFNETYDEHKTRNNFISRYDFVKDKQCCDKASCDRLADELQKTKHLCNDIFGKIQSNITTDKGSVVGKTLCSTLTKQFNQTLQMAIEFDKKTRTRGGKKRTRKYTAKRRRGRR